MLSVPYPKRGGFDAAIFLSAMVAPTVCDCRMTYRSMLDVGGMNIVGSNCSWARTPPEAEVGRLGLAQISIVNLAFY